MNKIKSTNPIRKRAKKKKDGKKEVGTFFLFGGGKFYSM